MHYEQCQILAMTNRVYLTSSSTFLPGDPIDNKGMVGELGEIDSQSRRYGRLILNQNKIKTRHYVPRVDGKFIYSNASMAAEAVKTAIETIDIDPKKLSHLATGTTQGDLLVPGHGSAVHGELASVLDVGSLELASFQSVCASSVMAARSAVSHIALDHGPLSCATGSEFSSRWFQPGFYNCAPQQVENRDTRMAMEFLRYTLSDGAGSVLFESKPRDDFPSYEVEAVHLVSLANVFDSCMYAGSLPEKRYDLSNVWSQYEDGPAAAVKDGALMLLQDMGMLKRIIRAWAGEYLKLVDQGMIDPKNVDHLLCHYSAHSLREELIRVMIETGGMIDEEKWFTNLYDKGNTGSAAAFIMLDEFSRKEIAKPGETVLCIIPESGRAMVGFILLRRV
jgi:3-oxoacyl-[acyl-carrier-protein] synthase-3